MYYLVTWGIGKPYGSEQKCTTLHQAQLLIQDLRNSSLGFQVELYKKHSRIQASGCFWEQILL
jgi:hypothetical protein